MMLPLTVLMMISAEKAKGRNQHPDDGVPSSDQTNLNQDFLAYFFCGETGVQIILRNCQD